MTMGINNKLITECYHNTFFFVFYSTGRGHNFELCSKYLEKLEICPQNLLFYVDASKWCLSTNLFSH